MSRLRTRSLLLVLALAGVAALLASCGGGGGTQTHTLTVIDASGAVNTAVTVHVRLNSSLGVGGYHIVLHFTQAKLQLDTVAKGAGVPAGSSFDVVPATPGVIDATVTGTGTFTGDDVLVATFTIISPSPSGTHNAITMPTATLADANGLPMTVSGAGGNVITN